jgi:hypothetical protein
MPPPTARRHDGGPPADSDSPATRTAGPAVAEASERRCHGRSHSPHHDSGSAAAAAAVALAAAAASRLNADADAGMAVGERERDWHEREDAGMAAAFGRMRQRLARLRRHNRAGRFREARAQAGGVLAAAAAAGCRRVAGRAARLLGGGGYIGAWALDEVEAQVDAAEALWRSGRCVV